MRSSHGRIFRSLATVGIILRFGSRSQTSARPARCGVRADGVELTGSPIRAGAGRYDGFLAVHDGIAHGWVTERRIGFEAPSITLIDQNHNIVASGESVLDRDADDPFFTQAKFHFALPASCFGRRRLRLRALANDVEFGSPQNCALRLTGFLDVVSTERCAGWLMSRDAPARRFDIEVLRDGQLVGCGRCNLARVDLRDSHPQSWEVGFDLRLTPSEATEAPLATMSVRLAGSEAELFDGPFIVGPRWALIATSHRVARLSHGTVTHLSFAERAVLQAAMTEYTQSQRTAREYVRLKQADRALPDLSSQRLTVVIPVFANVELTRICIASVLLHRSPHDAVVLVNDCSPDPDMFAMLAKFAREPRVTLLTNGQNLGFIKSVNLALEFCDGGDVVLLNSDTEMFAGGSMNVAGR